MGGINLENGVKFQIHEPSELGHKFLIFDSITEDNVLITYIKIL